MASVPLHRVRSGAVIFGVCTGLGRYLDVDPVLIRVGFVLLALASGLGVLAYLVLAIAMPSEATVGESSSQVVRDNLREMGGLARAAGQEMVGRLMGEDGAGRRRRALGVALAAVGGLLLLVNVGLLTWVHWRVWWPLLLVLLGVMLAGHRGEGRC